MVGFDGLVKVVEEKLKHVVVEPVVVQNTLVVVVVTGAAVGGVEGGPELAQKELGLGGDCTVYEIGNL